ncbi:hypothetical protein ES703_94325 [subsurface metagenome]
MGGLLSEELLRQIKLLKSDEIGIILNRGIETLIRRSEPEKHDHKDRLGKALNSQIYNIYVYVFKHNPTKRDLNKLFPESTVNRAIYELELAKVIEERNGRYYVIF